MSPVVNQSESRQSMHEYWSSYSHKPTECSMMLSEKAPELKDDDRAVILASLPDLTGADIVDVGAGIGRFTTPFAGVAKSVTAVDFIESFLEKNRQTHADNDNVHFINSDAAHLQLPDRSVDFVFTNWLLMYLDDDECIGFLRRTLHWLRPGGMLHVRESCSQPSSKKKTGDYAKSIENPTFYRQKCAYINLFSRICDDAYELKPIWAKSVSTYVKKESNWRQVHWLLVKQPTEVPRPPVNDAQLRALIGQTAADAQQLYETNRHNHIHSRLHRAHVDTLASLTPPGARVLLVESGDNHVLCPLALANAVPDSRVLSLHTSAAGYRAATSDMNDAKNQAVRSMWLPSLSSDDVSQLSRSGLEFELSQLTGVQLLRVTAADGSDQSLLALLALLTADANGACRLTSLERADDAAAFTQQLKSLQLECIFVEPCVDTLTNQSSGLADWVRVTAVYRPDDRQGLQVDLVA